MADQAKKTNPKPKNDTNPGKNMETSIYSERLKAAVNDAQYLVEYVAEKHLQNINHRTINTLVDAKRFIEDEHGFNSEKESNFWLAYHELCSQISPVTIESIKASLPIGRLAANRPVSENLGITGLLKKINVSRVNVAMFFSVTLTILALLVVLFFQIYWVVGDQLSTQL